MEPGYQAHSVRLVRIVSFGVQLGPPDNLGENVADQGRLTRAGHASHRREHA